MAVLASITLLPSVLIALGDRIDKWQLLKEKSGEANGWRKFANAVIKRPVMITIVAFILLGIAIIPVKNMDLTIPAIDSLPKSYDTRQAFELIDREFGLADQAAVYVIAERADGWEDEKGLQSMKALEKELSNDPLVDKVTTIFTASDIDSVEQWEQAMMVPEIAAGLSPLIETFVKDDKLMIPVTLGANGSSDAAQDWVRDWSDKQTEWNLSIGGQPKFNQEIFDEIFDKILYVLLVIVVSTFFILMIAFKSILIPIKAIFMNIVGLAATFGILVYIFQYGHFGLEAGHDCSHHSRHHL